MMQREDIYVAKGEKGHAVFFGENPHVPDRKKKHVAIWLCGHMCLHTPTTPKGWCHGCQECALSISESVPKS